MDPKASQHRQWEPHQAAFSGRNRVAINTWRPSFGSAYRVSIEGLSGPEAAERLHRLAHDWMNRKIYLLAGNGSSAVEVPPFGVSLERLNLTTDGISCRSSSFMPDQAVRADGLPERAWQAAFEHRDIEQSGRSWRLSLGCKTIDGSKAEVLLAVESAIKDVVVLPEPVLTAPFVGFLRQQLGDAVTIQSGRTILSGAPIRVDHERAVWELFGDLRDETRTHPVVLVSGHYAIDGTCSYLVDPYELARSVGAVAKVYVEGPVKLANSVGLKDILVDQLGFEPEHLAWGGAVRVYQPGDITSSPAPSHRYFSLRPNQTEEQVRSLVIERAYWLGSGDLRAHPLNPIIRVEDLELLNTRQQVMRLRAQSSGATDAASLTKEADEWKEIAGAYSAEVDELKRQMRQQSTELEAAKGTIDQLSNERAEVVAINVQLQEELARLRREVGRGGASENGKQIDPEQLASGKEVLEAVQANFSDRIVFTERGKKTLSEFSVEQKELYAHIYHAVQDLYTILYPRRFGAEPGNFIIAFRDSSRYALTMAEGSLTKEKPGIEETRKDIYNGQAITAWAHVKFGNKPGEQFRLHFDFVGEGDDGRIVVSWVGDHMPTAASSKSGKRRG